MAICSLGCSCAIRLVATGCTISPTRLVSRSIMMSRLLCENSAASTGRRVLSSSTEKSSAFRLGTITPDFGSTTVTRILVTVVDPKSGVMVPNLKAEDFSVLDDKTLRPVEAAEFSHNNLDIMMLLDTSLVGEMVHPVATNLIAQ